MVVEVARRRFTRAEYHRMAEVGILGPSDRVELADDTEPQPDLVVLRLRQAPGDLPYKDAEPTTADVLLLVEVAETSLAYDRSVKLRLYAEAGIPEYWVVDGAAERVEVYRDPGPTGYRDATRLEGDTALAPATFPDVSLRLAEIFA